MNNRCMHPPYFRLLMPARGLRVFLDVLSNAPAVQPISEWVYQMDCQITIERTNLSGLQGPRTTYQAGMRVESLLDCHDGLGTAVSISDLASTVQSSIIIQRMSGLKSEQYQCETKRTYCTARWMPTLATRSVLKIP